MNYVGSGQSTGANCRRFLPLSNDSSEGGREREEKRLWRLLTHSLSHTHVVGLLACLPYLDGWMHELMHAIYLNQERSRFHIPSCSHSV